MNIEKIISEMTLEEKASFVSGHDMWTTEKFERVGIPSIFMSDGPHGLRKQEKEPEHLLMRFVSLLHVQLLRPLIRSL